MKNKKAISQLELTKEFFHNNPNKDIPHSVFRSWAETEFLKRTGRVLADPDRGVRKLSQQGYLMKIKKGYYRFDPEHIKTRDLEDFKPAVKKAIFERDGHKCVLCGRGAPEGYEIHADHIKAKDFGGRATLENGQTLCGPHNFLKKNFKQTETGKKLFIRLYELAKSENDQVLINFSTEILTVFEKNGINGHIEWKK